jgi:hypothetical protein
MGATGQQQPPKPAEAVHEEQHQPVAPGEVKDLSAANVTAPVAVPEAPEVAAVVESTEATAVAAVEAAAPTTETAEPTPVAEVIDVGPIAPELAAVQSATQAPALGITDPASIDSMPEESQEVIRQRIYAQLEAAKTAEAKVRVLAKWTDKRAGDAIISTMLPALGDFGTSIMYTVYLMNQAEAAGLPGETKNKIVSQQIIRGIGEGAANLAVPVVGKFIIDYFIQANSAALKEFEKHSAELAQQAREAGVPEADIQALEQKGEAVQKAADGLARFIPKFLQKLKDKA